MDEKELERRLALAAKAGYENPEDAVQLLHASTDERFPIDVRLLARSGRLPMKPQERVKIRL